MSDSKYFTTTKRGETRIRPEPFVEDSRDTYELSSIADLPLCV
jgi:hypothetical protein